MLYLVFVTGNGYFTEGLDQEIMKVLNKSYRKMLLECPSALPETGIILGVKNGIVTECEFDEGMEYGEGCYCPNIARIEKLAASWKMNNIALGGIAHSHVPNGRGLSDGDVAYIKQIMECQTEDVGVLYFPIVIPGEEIIAFSAAKDRSGTVIRHEGITLIM